MTVATEHRRRLQPSGEHDARPGFSGLRSSADSRRRPGNRRGRIRDLGHVYDAVFADWPDRQAWGAAVWDKHSGRPGFRLARGYDSDGLVGFACGYTGQPGQWWTDQARHVLAPPVAHEWLGGHFELVSIGVVRRARGHRVGRGLLRDAYARAFHTSDGC